MGDWDQGVIFLTRENGGQEDRDLGSSPLSSASLGRIALNPLPSTQSQLTGCQVLHLSASGACPQGTWRQRRRWDTGRRGWVSRQAERAVLARAPLSGLYPAQLKGLPVFRLSARRRLRCSFLRSSRIRVHPTPAASAMPPKFDPNEIKVGACFRCGRGCGKASLLPAARRACGPSAITTFTTSRF